VRIRAHVHDSLTSGPVIVSSREMALPGSDGDARTPFILGTDMVAPQQVRRTPPPYPAMARLARLQGTVVLDAVIDTSGRVTDVKVVKGNPLLADSLVSTVKQWLYRPARDAQGHAVPVYFRITTSFKYGR